MSHPRRDLQTAFPLPTSGIAERLRNRIGLTPPYFALQEMALEGTRFVATALAEAPAFGEVAPMTAAEIGRHSAIAGLSHAALTQEDDRRRYYLARQAECRYYPSDAGFGEPVRFSSQIRTLDKRSAEITVTAQAGGAPLAEIDLSYTILSEAAFGRLFRRRQQPVPDGPNPYFRHLIEAYDGDADHAEQLVPCVPPSACRGHFPNYPALPVAVVMGQLSYLAGQLMDRPYRVLSGSVSAADLGWAGERVRFRAERQARRGNVHQFLCMAFAASAHTDEREIGRMTLQLEQLCD